MARAGNIGIVMSNASPAVPPWQGKSPRLGTNPICMTVPSSGAGKWQLDMATTTVALGKVGHAAQLEQTSIPAWWGFLDAGGKATTNLKAAQKGVPTPIGGYKGTGLGMMVEILCAVLSSGPMSSDVPINRTGADPLRVSHMFLAIDPTRFLPRDQFQARMERLVNMMKSSEPAPGFDEVLIAGEPEWRAEKERRREGIPVPVRLWENMATLAQSLKVAPPLAIGSKAKP
jgi:LDH2 family malate/lactate/ureidoglycolate dehydrogenase